ncbi:MAG: TrgA family protein [Pseudomonadota bacterium]
MLTAARLVAALLFAGLGYVAGGFVTDTFPEGISHDWFEPSIAALGLWQGWTVMGKSVGLGLSAAIGNGIRTSAGVVFFGLIYYALREMFIRSSDLRYTDFGVAIIDALNLFMEYGAQFFSISPAWSTLLVGGMVAGLLTEGASRIWR